jgi:hypothetical protein
LASVGATASTARASAAAIPSGRSANALQEHREVLAQQRPQLDGGATAPPGGILVGAGEHRDRLGKMGVGRQPTVRMRIGAQDVRQHDGIGVVGFLARHRRPLPVTGNGHRVDRIDRATGSPQRGHQQPTRCLDRDRDQIVFVLAGVGEQLQQLVEPRHGVRDSAFGNQPAVGIDQSDVVMVRGPIDPAGDQGHVLVLLACSNHVVCRALGTRTRGTLIARLAGPTSD